MATNVKASDLNYDRYSDTKYDRDIVNSIPYHKKLHSVLASQIKQNYSPDKSYRILDLGVGTGITTAIIRELLPLAHLDVVDFSRQMLKGARKKLGTKNVTYIFGDYSKIKFRNKYDLVVSVIGIHHQTDPGKKKLFAKVYGLLKPGGMFLFGDLVTYSDKFDAAYNHALHFAHLVERSADARTLREWAHHHMFLNLLAPIEDQIRWLKKAGFSVKTAFLKMNTALLVCRKAHK